MTEDDEIRSKKTERSDVLQLLTNQANLMTPRKHVSGACDVSVSAAATTNHIRYMRGCYAPAPNRRGHYAMMLSDVCLSVAYIGPKSRTERSRKTKIGTKVAHVTHDLDTTFKIKRSRSPGRFTHRSVNASGTCSGERGNVLSVETYCYVTVCRRGGRLCGARRFGAHRGRRGAWAYRGGRPPTACLFCYSY